MFTTLAKLHGGRCGFYTVEAEAVPDLAICHEVSVVPTCVMLSTRDSRSPHAPPLGGVRNSSR